MQITMNNRNMSILAEVKASCTKLRLGCVTLRNFDVEETTDRRTGASEYGGFAQFHGHIHVYCANKEKIQSSRGATHAENISIQGQARAEVNEVEPFLAHQRYR